MSPEPNDRFEYEFFDIDGELLRLAVAGAELYRKLLKEDAAVLETDEDLRSLIESPVRETFSVYGEIARLDRAIEWLQAQIAESGPEAPVYYLSLSHGVIRNLKAFGLLRLSRLRQRRDAVAVKPAITRHALAAIDLRLRHFEELLNQGAFGVATPIKLMADDIAPIVATPVQHASPTTEHLVRHLSRSIVIADIQVRDEELRGRCLDLFSKFQDDETPSRLDTVVTEATRILETRLRSAAKAPADKVGVALAAYALAGTSPPIVLGSTTPEQEGAHALFRGAFAFVRNRFAHNLVPDLSLERAIQIVGFVDYLLSLLTDRLPAGRKECED